MRRMTMFTMVDAPGDDAGQITTLTWRSLPLVSLWGSARIVRELVRHRPRIRWVLATYALLPATFGICLGPTAGVVTLLLVSMLLVGSVLATLLVNRAGWGGRVIMAYDGGLTGMAFFTARRHRDDTGTYWKAGNLVSLLLGGSRPADPEDRVGRSAVEATAEWASENKIAVRLTATAELAERLYVPAGFAYMPGESGKRRPEMYLSTSRPAASR